MLLPGGSGAGKSTLTAAFAVMGLDYLTDEIALFTDDGLIRPFPKPLWLSSWSRQIFGIVDDDLGFVAPGFKAAVTPEDVGVGVATGDAVLGCVVLITRSEGTEIEEVRPSQGVAALMSSTYHLANRCVEAFYLATRAVRNSTVLQLRVDDPLKAAESLIGVLA